MKITQRRTINLGMVLSGGILPGPTGSLSAASSSLKPSSAATFAVPANDAPTNKTLEGHLGTASVAELVRPAFTWLDVATRGLALLEKCPETIMDRAQQDRLFQVLSMVIVEDAKDVYMVWEDFKRIDSSKPLPDRWLPSIVRHLRHGLRLRTLFGPEISDDHLLGAFSRWDGNITQLLRNINQMVAAASTVDGVTVTLPPVWRAAFSCVSSLIAADQQILSCYRPYWEALPWREDTEGVVFGRKPKPLGQYVRQRRDVNELF
jgi:hypothetical protein